MRKIVKRYIRNAILKQGQRGYSQVDKEGKDDAPVHPENVRNMVHLHFLDSVQFFVRGCHEQHSAKGPSAVQETETSMDWELTLMPRVTGHQSSENAVKNGDTRTNEGKCRNARAAFAFDLDSPCALVPGVRVCSLSLSSSGPADALVVTKQTSMMRANPASISV